MKKVFLRAYYNFNLGDDLFVDLICKRYSNLVTFYVDNKNYKFLQKRNNNIKIISNKFTSLYDKIAVILHNYSLYHTNHFVKKADALVVLGGSMFIEKPQKNFYDYLYDNYFKLNKNYYIIGANFGPYKNKQYFLTYKKIFSKAKDVCVRDKNSYELFNKQLNNIRYAPDIIFGYKKYLPTKKIVKNKIFISVIDLEQRSDINKYENDYINKISDICNYYLSYDYEIVLSSFCKSENDENMIKKISSKINFKKIKVLNYNKNIDEILNEMQESKIIIGSRFHSIVLGIILNKYILPISYSNKTINLLNDLNFKGEWCEIKNINKLNYELNNIVNEKQKIINVENFIQKSNENFKMLDVFLVNGEINYE